MKNQYSFSELLKTIYSLITTKITYPQARLIRNPIYIRGHRRFQGGKGLTTGRFCRFDLAGDKTTLVIGNSCEFGDMTHIVAHERVEIGDNVLIASKCFISDTNHGTYADTNQDNPEIPPKNRKYSTKPVKIGSNVWIGENVVLLAGAVIGDGCIVGANSLVKQEYPANSILVGSPARIVKQWNKDKQIWEKKEGR